MDAVVNGGKQRRAGVAFTVAKTQIDSTGTHGSAHGKRNPVTEPYRRRGTDHGTERMLRTGPEGEQTSKGVAAEDDAPSGTGCLDVGRVGAC